jgi:two-component system, LuxR family, sensor kinase FixL
VTNRQRRLWLSTQARGPDGLLIRVEDTGSGIDPGHADRIFEPFFTTKSQGMGMGLSICRSIIENHGGHISVAAGRAHGSVFQVSLPIAPIVVAEAAAVSP